MPDLTSPMHMPYFLVVEGKFSSMFNRLLEATIMSAGTHQMHAKWLALLLQRRSA